jgi:biotin carboxyl carrier protein
MFTYQHRDESYNVQLEPLPDGSYRATINGRVTAFAAQPVAGGWLLTFPESGARKTMYVTIDDDTRTVSDQGETYTLARETQRQRRRSVGRGGHGGSVSAQMPGQVREVLVAAGETVERGQTLVVLEAMKMELRAAAPADGKIKRLLVAAGDVVARGQLLVEIE